MPVTSDDKLTTSQLREKYMARQKALAEKWDRARVEGPDGKAEFDFAKLPEYSGDPAAALEQMQAEQRELDDLRSKIDIRSQLDKTAAGAARRADAAVATMTEPVTGLPASGGKLDIGTLFVQSDAYRAGMSTGQQNPQFTAHFPEFDIRNAVVSTSAGFDPPSVRTGRVVDSGQSRIRMVDVVPSFPTSADTIRYMEETTYTDTAIVEKSEQTAAGTADVVGEAALAWTERTQTVEWLPAFIPATTQQLEDVEGIQARISDRLGRMVRGRLSGQIAAGNGTSPNLLGLQNRSGVTTTGKGSDDTPTAIYRRIAVINAKENRDVDTIVLNPTDWVEIRTLKTTDGQFIWGSPAMAGPQTLWGYPVSEAGEITVGTGWVGDFGGYAGLYIKRGATLAVSDSHGSMFTRGQLAIRVDMRAAMVWESASAFEGISGI